MHTSNSQYFERQSIEKSTFGRLLLLLKHVRSIDLFVIVEKNSEVGVVNKYCHQSRLLGWFCMNKSFFEFKHSTMASINDKAAP